MENKKLTNQQYRFVSEMIWGCVPIDRDWAEGTSIFASSKDRILSEYPDLDRSIKTTTMNTLEMIPKRTDL